MNEIVRDRSKGVVGAVRNAKEFVGAYSEMSAMTDMVAGDVFYANDGNQIWRHMYTGTEWLPWN